MSLKETFYYDPTSPTGLRWKTDRKRGRGSYVFIRAGEVAGFFDEAVGYYRVYFKGKKQLAHRLVYMLHFDLDEEDDVDHKDGDSKNNRIGNLRAVTHKVNRRNSKRPENNTSGVTGVYKISSKKTPHLTYWAARWLTLDGKSRQKCFPAHSMGDQEAFEAACKYRKDMVDLLNNQGVGYTERHGT